MWKPYSHSFDAEHLPRNGKFADYEKITKNLHEASTLGFHLEFLSTKSLAKLFNCNPEDINEEDALELKRRMRFLYSQLTAVIAKSKKEQEPLKIFYALLEVQELLAFHDIIHAAVTLEKNHARGEEAAIPRFLNPEHAINDEQALREELDVLLFPRGESRPSIFFKYFTSDPSVSFEQAFAAYQRDVWNRLEGQTAHDLSEKTPKPTQEEIDAEMQKFKLLKAKIQMDPDRNIEVRARRIYDGWKKGNTRVLVDEFLTMTASIPRKLLKAV